MSTESGNLMRLLMTNQLLRFSILPVLAISFSGCSEQLKQDSQTNLITEWVLADLVQGKTTDVQITGNPKLVDSSHGKAVQFNGISDALFLEAMPLQSLEAFTIEMIFFPETDSPFEQRIVHIGEVDGDRMLLEIRVVDGTWYFDGFVTSKGSGMALIDEKLIHPLGQWHHVALVVDKDTMTTFVNGEKELSRPISYTPFESGRSSIGVRQNLRSWYKGLIYKIRITPEALLPDDFMTH